jgi:hypothetical protein
MTQFTDAQLAGLALSTGFTKEQAVTAVAIAIRESGGNSDARGDVGIQTAVYGPSIGLWQIRSLNAQKGTGGERDEQANLNPATNAKHAYSISKGGTNWQPWSTYKGIALTLPRAQKAVDAPDMSMAGGAAQAPGSTLGPNPSLWDAISAWLQAGLTRMAAGLAGLALILFGLRRLGINPMKAVPLPPAAKIAEAVAL